MLGDTKLIYFVSLYRFWLFVSQTFVTLWICLWHCRLPSSPTIYFGTRYPLRQIFRNSVTEICITYLRQTTCWPWVLWWRQSWCGRTASSSTPWTNLPQCTVTLILTFLQCLETDLWLISVDFFGNLPPGFSTPSLLWRYISFAGVSSRTSTSGNVEKEA